MVTRTQLREALAARLPEAPELPPDGGGGWIEIVSGGSKVRQSVALASPSYRPVWCHWAGQRSLPCLDREGHCPKELHTFPLVWHAYAWCYVRGSVQPRLLSLTYEGVRRCPELLAASTEGTCLGEVVEVGRGVGRASKQQVIVWANVRIPEVRPVVRPLDDALWQLWGAHPLVSAALSAAGGELTRSRDWLATMQETGR